MCKTEKPDKHGLKALIEAEAAKFGATIKTFDYDRQILDLDCPLEKKVDCAMAIKRLLDQYDPE